MESADVWATTNDLYAISAELLDKINELRAGGPILDTIHKKLEFFQQSVISKSLPVSEIWNIVEGQSFDPDRSPLMLNSESETLFGSEQNDEAYFHDCCKTLEGKLLQIKSGQSELEPLRSINVLRDVAESYISEHKSQLESAETPSWQFFNHFTPSGTSLHSLLNDHEANIFAPVLTPQLFAAKTPTSALWLLFRMLLGLSQPLDSSRFSILSPAHTSAGLHIAPLHLTPAPTSSKHVLLGVLLLSSDLLPTHASDAPRPVFGGFPLPSNRDGPEHDRDRDNGGSQEDADDGEDEDQTFGDMLGLGVKTQLDELAAKFAQMQLDPRHPETH